MMNLTETNESSNNLEVFLQFFFFSVKKMPPKLQVIKDYISVLGSKASK